MQHCFYCIADPLPAKPGFTGLTEEEHPGLWKTFHLLVHIREEVKQKGAEVVVSHTSTQVTTKVFTDLKLRIY